MKIVLARPRVRVVKKGHALVKYDSFNDMPLVFSGSRAETENAYQSISNPGGSHELPGYFPKDTHGGPRHTVAETSAASLRRSRQLGMCEDRRLPIQRKGKRLSFDCSPFGAPRGVREQVLRRSNPLCGDTTGREAFRGQRFSLSFSLSGDNSSMRRPGQPHHFLGGSPFLSLFASLL